MQLPDDRNPTTSTLDRPAMPNSWLARLLGGGLLAICVVVAAAVAIGAGGSSAAPTILNTEKVEQAIERSSLAQRGIHAIASCPAGVQQQEGLKFSCTAVAQGVGTRFVVTELDGSGHVHYEAHGASG